MYTAFYGLREKPFQLSPDPRFLFLAESHREALAHLLFGIEQEQGFIVVTGEVGTGKTTLCRTLLKRVDPGAEVAILFNPQLSATELLQAIHVELGLDPSTGSRRELMEGLNRFLLEKKGDGRRVLLIVDEAQTLTPEALEQIRMLSNLETETSKLIQIILLGQPEFDAMLESPSLRQLRQRISVRWRLAPLGAAETAEYVRHRLRIAARARREVFSEAALREIHQRSGGIPRVINLLCDRALLAGYAAGEATVQPALVRQADEELRGGSHAPSLAKRAPRAAALQRAVPLVGLLSLGVLVGVGLQRLTGEPTPAPPSGGSQSAAAAAPRAAPPEATIEWVPEPEPLPVAEPVASELEPSPAPEPAPSPRPIARTVRPLDGAELDALLAQADAALGTATALDAALSAWGLAPSGARSLTPAAAAAELSSRGLAVHSLMPADVGALTPLGHLALLTLRSPVGAPRTVLLTAVGSDDAVLVGLRDDATSFTVTRSALDARVAGAARVIWRDFEGLPPVLRWGFQGPAVAWLQRSLVELGYLDAPVSGEYDDATVSAVRAFQSGRGLTPDGEVGPRTKMALYSALTAYPVPRLEGSG